MAIRSMWLLVPFLYLVPPVAGAVLGWITFRRRGWKTLLAVSAVWGACWLIVWLVLPGLTAAEATGIAVWFAVAPCVIGGVLAALAGRIGVGGRVVDRQ